VAADVLADVPRSRLVKYPLLLKTIQKHVSVNILLLVTVTLMSRCCTVLLALDYSAVSLLFVMDVFC